MKSKRDLPKAYESDWKVASAARVMALLCKLLRQRVEYLDAKRILLVAANQKSNAMALSIFYNTMVDCIHLMADFESWQSRSG